MGAAGCMLRRTLGPYGGDISEPGPLPDGLYNPTSLFKSLCHRCLSGKVGKVT